MLPDPPASGIYDAVVIGAGPAGSTVARLLTAWGRTTLWIGRPGDAGRVLVESLPPSTRRVMDLLDLGRVVARAAFPPYRGNTVWWGADVESPRFAADTPGYQVDRRRLDRILRDAAVHAGARLRVDTAVVDADVSGPGTASIVCRGRDTLTTVRAAFCIDCSGRAGVIARRGLRRTEPESTLALIGRWRSDAGWNLEDSGDTVVESYADGWAWSVPAGAGERQFTVMVDPRLTRIYRDKDPGSIYGAEIAKTRHVRDMLAGAEPAAPVWVCDASAYSAERYAGDRFLLVGDAGSAIDPLSSLGVKKAMVSAWMASVVVNTCLAKPEMAGAALDLFDRRERETYTSVRRLGERQFAEAGRWHDEHFWTDRAAIAEPGHEAWPAGDRLTGHPAVRAAFERIRAGAGRLRPAPDARVEARPVIIGREVSLEDRVVSAALPDGLRTVARVDLVRLFRLLDRGGEVPALFEACARVEPLTLADFLLAVAVMAGTGLVLVE